MSRWSVPFEFSSCGGKTKFTHAIAANKPANSHNFKIKNLNLLTINFLADYSMNRGKSSHMRVNILSVRSLTVFKENIVVTVLANAVPLFFKSSCAFFSYAFLIDRCQIVTDICKNNVSKWFGSL